MKGLTYQLKSVLRDKFCLMTFLLPILVAVALNFMGSIDLSSLGELHFGVLENDLPPQTITWLEQYGPVTAYGMAIIRGDVFGAVLCACLSLAVFAAVAAGVVFSFGKISQSLCSSFAKHNYRMGKLKADSLLRSLCKREFRRYFSSSIYVF